MSFLGKKYKLVSSENIEKYLEAAKVTSDRAKILTDKDTAFKLTRIDDHNYTFTLIFGGNAKEYPIKLGEEHEVKRDDGSTLKITSYLEGNVFNQTIKDDKGRQFQIKREFDGNRSVATLSVQGVDVQGKIHYEAE